VQATRVASGSTTARAAGPCTLTCEMTDWTTTSSLATAAGTLVLAVATFASVRSANRAARTAERALQAGMRPLLVPSRFDDPVEKIMWGDDHWAKVGGGRASVEVAGGHVYLAIPLRNVASGIAVLQGWHAAPAPSDAGRPHRDPEEFRHQIRDLYVPGGDVGYWQGALRDPDEVAHKELVDAIEQRQRIAVELLYSDLEGGQRAIARFALNPRDGGDDWLSSIARVWNLDRPDPR
jgi:hypothetical protein